MKQVVAMIVLIFSSVGALAAKFDCRVGVIEGGRVVQESKYVSVEGEVDVTINDFDKSANIIGRIQGRTDGQGFQFSLIQTEKDIMVSAGSSDPEITVQLYVDQQRFFGSCWKSK